MNCTGCSKEMDPAKKNNDGHLVCSLCGRAIVPLSHEDIAGFAINPYAPPLPADARPKRPAQRFDKQFWWGIGCLAGGFLLSAISVNFLLFGNGVMPIYVIALGPTLILVGMMYLFFWYGD